MALSKKRGQLRQTNTLEQLLGLGRLGMSASLLSFLSEWGFLQAGSSTSKAVISDAEDYISLAYFFFFFKVYLKE